MYSLYFFFNSLKKIKSQEYIGIWNKKKKVHRRVIAREKRMWFWGDTVGKSEIWFYIVYINDK